MMSSMLLTLDVLPSPNVPASNGAKHFDFMLSKKQALEGDWRETRLEGRVDKTLPG